METYTCNQPSFANLGLAGSQDMCDAGYTVIEELSMRYREVDPPKFGLGFPKYSDQVISSHDLLTHAGVLMILLVVRLTTIMIDNGIRFNATKKVYYIKRALAIAWIRYLKLVSDQENLHPIEWYILMGCGIFECMSLFDMFSNTELPFLGNNRQLVQQENGIARYSNDEHEFIDSFNLFDIITISLNILFIGFTLNALYGSHSDDLYLEEWGIYCNLEICIMTLCLLIKPYESIRFYSLVTLGIPTVIFTIYTKQYLKVFDYSLINIVIFVSSKVWLYITVFVIYTIIKSYVL